MSSNHLHELFIVQKGTNRPVDLLSHLLGRRVITIRGEITQESALSIVLQLEVLKKESKSDPIKIMFSSHGGCVSSGLSIIDKIKEIQKEGCQIIGEAIGTNCSMSSVIFLNCSRRLMQKHSRLMFHDVSAVTRGQFKDLKADFDNIETIRNHIYNNLKEVIAKTKNNESEKTLALMMGTNFWLGSETALLAGFIEEII